MSSFQRTPLQIALRKRADALRSIETRKRSIAELEHRVAEIDSEIAALGGRKLPEYVPRLPFRANGEMQRALFDLLREKGQATAADLALVMLAHFGLDASDPKTAHLMRQRCIQAFKRCERNGLIAQTGWTVGKRGKRGRFQVFSYRGVAEHKENI